MSKLTGKLLAENAAIMSTDLTIFAEGYSTVIKAFRIRVEDESFVCQVVPFTRLESNACHAVALLTFAVTLHPELVGQSVLVLIVVALVKKGVGFVAADATVVISYAGVTWTSKFPEALLVVTVHESLAAIPGSQSQSLTKIQQKTLRCPSCERVPDFY